MTLIETRHLLLLIAVHNHTMASCALPITPRAHTPYAPCPDASGKARQTDDDVHREFIGRLSGSDELADLCEGPGEEGSAGAGA
jgi:hypothetical protein